MTQTHGRLHDIPVHDGLEDGGEGGDADAGTDKNGVLGVEDLGGGRPERPVDVHVQRLVYLHQRMNRVGICMRVNGEERQVNQKIRIKM